MCHGRFAGAGGCLTFLLVNASGDVRRPPRALRHLEGEGRVDGRLLSVPIVILKRLTSGRLFGYLARRPGYPLSGWQSGQPLYVQRFPTNLCFAAAMFAR